MPDKVIHVSDELHAVVKGYCDARGVKMTAWVDTVLRQGLRDGAMPVPQRDLPKTVYDGEPEDKLFMKSPFWANRGDR